MSYKNGQSYQEHFEWLKDKFITRHPRARCWVCGNRNKKQLTLHHQVYDPWKEKLNRDLFIVCKHEGKCHTKIHYITLVTTKIQLPQDLWRLRRCQVRSIFLLRTAIIKLWTSFTHTNTYSIR